MNRRRVGAVLASTLVWSLLAAGPAFASLHRDDGDDPGKQISTLKAILVFGVVPLGVTAVISLLVMIPSLARGPRYRPGLDWQATPEWYGAEAATGTLVPSGDPQTETGDGGGSSARW